jgi:hypothetical protein
VTTNAARHPLFARCFMRLGWLMGTVAEVARSLPGLVAACGRMSQPRDTVGAIKAAGFHVERIAHVTVGPAWGVTNPHVIGLAT